ncbi:hypothetical protein K402DRAFT_396198 [Aulographum hederae CBS 113979]|uniref:Uncharacterized protein n=1 Tax=Aulographum hederae CBS 113979 TaxID=1176131 RepID=A0A6G1GT72_9PEZI|nr:hypothetical protein K402DRAFT_396198 [Aulographum hederae CBS 113979]
MIITIISVALRILAAIVSVPFFLVIFLHALLGLLVTACQFINIFLATTLWLVNFLLPSLSRHFSAQPLPFLFCAVLAFSVGHFVTFVIGTLLFFLIAELVAQFMGWYSMLCSRKVFMASNSSPASDKTARDMRYKDMRYKDMPYEDMPYEDTRYEDTRYEDI